MRPAVEQIDSISWPQFHSSFDPPSPETLMHKRGQFETHLEKQPPAWVRARAAMMEAFSEFMGTFVFITFALAGIAQVTLSNGASGNFTSIVFGFGVGIAIGALIAGKSGAHLNPGVTLAMCVYRRHPWYKLPIYAGAQMLGAFCAACVVYGNFKPQIDAFEGTPGLRTVPGVVGATSNATAGIFATYPGTAVAGNTTALFFAEITASALLVFVIFALCDEKNTAAGRFTPFGLGMCIMVITTGFGPQVANTARDLGPRVMTFFVGYGADVFKANGYFMWIPSLAPFLGALFGGFLYDLFLYEGESPINMPYLGLRRLSGRPESAA